MDLRLKAEIFIDFLDVLIKSIHETTRNFIHILNAYQAGRDNIAFFRQLVEDLLSNAVPLAPYSARIWKNVLNPV